MTAAPDGNSRMNFFDASRRRSSSEAPHMRRTALGLLMNPQSSAAMPRWRYSDCAEHGMSMNESDSTMDLENIRLSAMPYPLSIKSSFR